LRDTDLSWLQALRWPLLVALALLGAAVSVLSGGIGAAVLAILAGLATILAERAASLTTLTTLTTLTAIGAVAIGLMLLVLWELFAGLRWVYGR
jgi:uncharacterized membrane protein YjjP (DUF1212 family)